MGFTPWFRNQALALEGHPARVFAVHRTGLEVKGEAGDMLVPMSGRWFQLEAEERPTVGDWVMVDDAGESVAEVLERSSVLQRMHPGRPHEVQLLAANVDLLIIVTSCNEDFNPARLERYLALADESGVTSLVVLTKADLVESTEQFEAEARALRPDLEVLPVDATGEQVLELLLPWCPPASTVALVGSSGVGKSTLLNALAGGDLQKTQAIREDDGKGRHTTTHRSLHHLPHGALVVDSPGIRELALAGAELNTVFEDIEALAEQCRFNDCAHESEPGCAVQQAIADGALDTRRLESYRKLLREDRVHRETVAARHERVRRFGKQVKAAAAARQKRKEE